APVCQQQEVSLRADRNALDRPRMLAQPAELPARGYVPDLDRAIEACRGQAMAVKVESHTADTALVPGERAEGWSAVVRQGRAVPNADGVVRARGVKQPAVAAEGDPPGSVCVAAQSQRLKPVGHIPDLDGRILGPRRGQALAVGTEGQLEDATLVPAQRLDQPALIRVPNLDLALVAGREKMTGGR